MSLEKAKKAIKTFMECYENSGREGFSAKTMTEDSLRRYRMQLTADDVKKKENKLSALPSTKSRGNVDSISDSYLAEYHEEPDSISFTNRRLNDPKKDEMARWLTELFNYRSKYTAGFYAWHDKSIRAGLSTGIEAAMVCWSKESYIEVVGKRKAVMIQGQEQPIPPEMLVEAEQIAPELIQEVDVTDEVIVTDTWQVDQLIPGETVFWDPKISTMDVNKGQFVVVKLYWTKDQVLDKIDAGVFDKISEKDIDDLCKAKVAVDGDTEKSFGDPKEITSEESERIEILAYFYKEKHKKMVCFYSGDKDVSSPKDVNELYFNKRKVNRFPVVVGISRSMIYENWGASIPYLISSHEDEWNINRNDSIDASRQSLLNKWRISKGADVDINQLINYPAFFADQGDVEKIDMRMDISNVQRSMDQVQQEIQEIIPTGMSNRGRSIVPRGTNATLGASQMMEQDSLTKKNAQLTLRNETFMAPLLYIIVQMIFAYESDETIALIAGSNAKMTPPMYPDMQSNQMKVDFNLLDFPVDVSINAGRGNVPKYQKAQNLMQIAGWRKENQIPTNAVQIAQQLNVLAGFDSEQFDAPAPEGPPPPQVEYKTTVNVDFMTLYMAAPQEAMALLQKMISGESSVTANVKDNTKSNEMVQNGGMGAPPQRAQMPIQDGLGNAARAMSQGGQNGVPGGAGAVPQLT